MKAKATTWLILAAATTLMAIPLQAQAKGRRQLTDGERMVRQLLNAPDDDRNAAAKRLKKVGGRNALVALDFAARYDRDRDVRRHAQQAAKIIRRRNQASERAAMQRHQARGRRDTRGRYDTRGRRDARGRYDTRGRRDARGRYDTRGRRDARGRYDKPVQAVVRRCPPPVMTLPVRPREITPPHTRRHLRQGRHSLRGAVTPVFSFNLRF